jgi:hypothetical protein
MANHSVDDESQEAMKNAAQQQIIANVRGEVEGLVDQLVSNFSSPEKQW